GGTLVVSVTGSGANFTVSVTGMNGSGFVVASIPAGAATDLAGNSSTASTSTDNTVNFIGLPPETIGLRNPTDSKYYLRNSNSGGNADLIVLYGGSADVPITGD